MPKTTEHAPRFEALIDGMLPFNSFPALPDLPKNGMPMGPTNDGIFTFNPHEWQRKRIIESPGVAIMGKRDQGKSALAKNIAWYYSHMHTRPNDPDSPLQRIWIDDIRAHEWTDLALSRGFEPFVVRNARLNPLDKRMDESDQKQVVELMLRQADDARLGFNGTDTAVLIEAISHMNSPRDSRPSIHALARVLVEADLQMPELYQDAGLRLPFTEGEFRDAKLSLATRLSNLIRAEYSTVFGQETNQSVYDAISKQFVVADYSGAPEQVIRLMQLIFWSWKKQASENKTDLMTNMTISDEMYRLMRIPEIAQTLSDTIKQVRKSGEIIILLTHAIRDFAFEGDAGRIALGILAETPVKFVGLMEPSDADDVMEMTDCSKKVRDAITKLPPFHFMAFIGQQEPFIFKADIPEKVLALTRTNQALEQITGRETH